MDAEVRAALEAGTHKQAEQIAALREFLAIADERAGTEHTNRVLAEAHVEALSEALRSILLRCEEGAADTDWLPTIALLARAALACPPQQRGEK